jgi:hypothetical protein
MFIECSQPNHLFLPGKAAFKVTLKCQTLLFDSLCGTVPEHKQAFIFLVCMTAYCCFNLSENDLVMFL